MNNFTEKSDDVLVELTLLGEENAYAELVMRHEEAVKGAAYKVTHNRFFAEDASQDAFVSAWIHLDSLRDYGKFRSFVCTIAGNCAKSIVRNYSKSIPDISFHDFENPEWDEEAQQELYSLSRSEGEKEALQDAVDALSEKIREVIQLHYFGGYSVDEIARKLSLPAGTVKWRLSEGRKQLRKGYGIMEKEYDEKEPLLDRVMRQIEELKLWRLKNSKKGFKEEYQAVLQTVEELPESKEKSHALADVLELGYWFLEDTNKEELLEKIKKAAIEGHNEDVMLMVVSVEHQIRCNKKTVKDCMNYLLDEQIPTLEKSGFVRSLGYEWDWYGKYCMLSTGKEKREKGRAAFRKVLELLEPTDLYYAAALSALHVEEEREKMPEKQWQLVSLRSFGEEIHKIGNKIYSWSRDIQFYKFRHNYIGQQATETIKDAVFLNASFADKLIFDGDMKVGESYRSSDDAFTLTVKEQNATVQTSSGVFENCTVVELAGNDRTETVIDIPQFFRCLTWFCPGVGIVKQTVKERKNFETVESVMELSSYHVNGGSDLLPLSEGNEWHYQCLTLPKGKIIDYDQVYKVTGVEGGKAILSGYVICKPTGYTDTWHGNILRATEQCLFYERENLIISDVSAFARKAKAQASTKRERLHAEILGDVVERIYRTSPLTNPDYTTVGRFEFFEKLSVAKDGKEIRLKKDDTAGVAHIFKYDTHIGEGHKAIYNDIYGLLSDPMECIWSENWVPGYRYSKTFDYLWNLDTKLSFEVLEDESVTVKAGHFENCRHILLNIQGMSNWTYRGGELEFWFAPGVGIVKFNRKIRYIGCDPVDNVWELTEYLGTGEGYFPTEDGMVRKYEQTTLGNGWHGSVEYTYDGNGTDVVIFRNATCLQDRPQYELFLKNYEENE